MSKKLQNKTAPLFDEIRQLIESARSRVKVTVNAELTLLYWNIGKHIDHFVLKQERAEYGMYVLQALSEKLTQEYGKGWGLKHLQHCLRSAEIFQEDQIVYAVRRQLSWTHIRSLMYIDDSLKREFYMEICIAEQWSTRQLDERINSMLYERTAISKKPALTIANDIEKLRT